MKQLHTSYSNLGSWRAIRDSNSGQLRIQFDQRRGIITSILLFVLCLIATVWLCGAENSSSNDGAKVAGIWIVSLTGLAVPLGILSYGASQKKKGDLIRYNIKEDILELPRIQTTIEKARQRAYLSSEHFSNMSDHFFELNLVIDGQRTKFLSSSVANGFRNIVKPLESVGFAVNHQKIKIK